MYIKYDFDISLHCSQKVPKKFLQFWIFSSFLFTLLLRSSMANLVPIRIPTPKVPSIGYNNYGTKGSEQEWDDDTNLPIAYDAVPVSDAEPSAPPLSSEDLYQYLYDTNGDLYDLRHQTNGTCYTQCCSSCTCLSNCLSCCWKPSMIKYMVYGLADLL